MATKDTLSSCSNSDEQQMQQIQDKAKKSCMVSFRLLHSHLKLLSNNDLKGTRIECGFKRAFATLFGQDVETFTGTMFLNMDQLDKQLDKEEFQEIGSMDSGLIVLVFQKGDDPIDAINHMMSFLTAVVTSRYPTTNNQLRNLSNPRQQATINDGE
ncbi:hypothetical protein Tco_0404353 [Tanacetum coccineum]